MIHFGNVRHHPRRQHQQARTHRPRPQTDPAEQPGAEVLQRDDVAGPAAEPAAEDQRRRDQAREQQEAGIDAPFLERLHRLGRLDRCHRLPGQTPVQEVQADQHVHADQHVGALARRRRLPHRAALRLVPVLPRQGGEHVAWGLRTRGGGSHRAGTS
jgi:hypothetical protein